MEDERTTESARGQLACVVLSFRDSAGLVEAVRSVVSQTPQTELVVVNSDGGDPRATLGAAGLEVTVSNFRDRLLPGAARNVGVRATTARYVAFLAADCVAEPGWVAGRLALHQAGAAAVAGVITNPAPRSRSACAAHLLLHNRYMSDTPDSERRLYGRSYDRALFDRFGEFREDLPAGEDTDFNARLDKSVAVSLAPSVRTAHRNPTAPVALIRDQYRRGRRRAIATQMLTGRTSGTRIARDAIANVVRCQRQIRRTSDPASRRDLQRARPLLVPAALAYAAGAIAAGAPLRTWRRDPSQPHRSRAEAGV